MKINKMETQTTTNHIDAINNKKTALDKIAELALRYDISLDEIGAQVTQTTLNNNINNKGSKWLTALLAYVGAAFVFGGLALLISMIWDDLGSPSRVIITYGPGFIAFILGIVVLKDERFVKASTPLFLKSAVLLPLGMFVFLHEYADGDDGQLAAMIVFAILSLQFFLAFFSLQRTSLLFFAYLFWNGSVGILMDRSGMGGEWLGIILGSSILMVAWSLDKTSHRAISPFWYFIGGVGLLWSVFDLLEGIQFVDILYLPLTIAMMLVSTQMRSRTLLLVSTFALLGFLGYFTEEYFADITGWPVALMIMGFLLIGISAYAVKLGQAIVKDA